MIRKPVFKGITSALTIGWKKTLDHDPQYYFDAEHSNIKQHGSTRSSRVFRYACLQVAQSAHCRSLLMLLILPLHPNKSNKKVEI